MDALLREFQDFWRNNSEVWEQWTKYTEAFPHLLLMAFMQRVVNGCGRVEREYATGRGRMDLAVEYKGEWNIVEIKLLRKGRTFDRVKAEGLKQIARYRETFVPPVGYRKNITGAYLVIFDRRPEDMKPSWDERITWEKDGDVTVLGC
jgi:RecB family endonuclease NucS